MVRAGAKLLARATRAASWPDHNLLLFRAVGADGGPVADDEPPLPAGALAIAEGGWLSLACGADHFAELVIEVWSRRPTDQTGWQESVELDVATHGGVALEGWELTGGPDTEPVAVPVTEVLHALCLVTGRSLPPGEVHVERWLVQLWPSPASSWRTDGTAVTPTESALPHALGVRADPMFGRGDMWVSWLGCVGVDATPLRLLEELGPSTASDIATAARQDAGWWGADACHEAPAHLDQWRREEWQDRASTRAEAISRIGAPLRRIGDVLPFLAACGVVADTDGRWSILRGRPAPQDVVPTTSFFSKLVDSESRMRETVIQETYLSPLVPRHGSLVTTLDELALHVGVGLTEMRAALAAVVRQGWSVRPEPATATASEPIALRRR